MKRKSHRPILDIPATPLEGILQLAAALGLLALWILPLYYWHLLPDKIPVHFGAAGQPNSWGGKSTLFLLPFIGALMYAMLTLVRRFPHRYNYVWAITPENSSRQYLLARTMMGWLRAETAGLLLWLEWRLIQVGMGMAQGLGIGFLPLILVVVFGTMIAYLYGGYKAR